MEELRKTAIELLEQLKEIRAKLQKAQAEATAMRIEHYNKYEDAIPCPNEDEGYNDALHQEVQLQLAERNIEKADIVVQFAECNLSEFLIESDGEAYWQLHTSD